jgi:hypothetical protein
MTNLAFLVREAGMSGRESDEVLKSVVGVKLREAMLTTVANEIRARYEPAEGMPPEITALLKRLDQRQDDDQ